MTDKCQTELEFENKQCQTLRLALLKERHMVLNKAKRTMLSVDNDRGEKDKSESNDNDNNDKDNDNNNDNVNNK